jgi:predicted ATPase
MKHCMLIGKNGTGKSTVGTVLSLLRRMGQSATNVGALVEPGDFYFGQSDLQMRFEVALELEGKRFEYQLGLELPPRFRQLRVADERLTMDGAVIFERQLDEVLLTRDQSAIRFPMDWHMLGLGFIHERNSTEPMGIFKRALARICVLRPVPFLIAGESRGEVELPDPECSQFAAWFRGLSLQYPASYVQIDNYLKTVIPGFADLTNVTLSEEAKEAKIRFSENGRKFDLPISALSDGQKCFLVAAVLLAASEVRGPMICYWDEPDNFLALAEVEHFLLELNVKLGNRGQIITSSHHPNAIEQVAPEGVILFYRESAVSPVRSKKLSEIEMQSDIVTALQMDHVPA